LIERGTGRLVAEVIVPKTISEGGLYSIGADKRILGNVVVDLVDQIDKTLKRP
jgi:hypothetical protein